MPNAYKDISGQKFSRLTVVCPSNEARKDKLKSWHCVCDCGNSIVVPGAWLRKGNTKSCGCLQKEKAAQNGKNTAKHGMTHSKEYSAWRSMLKRCLLPSDKNFHNYGGRGIGVCEEWRNFENFYQDMGKAPFGTSLDRINVNLGYSKENCRWADMLVQSNNKRASVYVEHEGKKLTIAQWGNELGVPRPTMYWRARKGWDDKSILLGRNSA